MRKSRRLSTLAQFARLLRDDRGLTQTELADLAGVNISTVKNFERDRPTSFETLVQVYRAGLAGKYALKREDWERLVGCWLRLRFPDGVDPATVLQGIRAMEETEQTEQDAAIAKLATAARKLDASGLATLTAVATAAHTQRGPHLFEAIRAMLAI